MRHVKDHAIGEGDELGGAHRLGIGLRRLKAFDGLGDQIGKGAQALAPLLQCGQIVFIAWIVISLHADIMA